MHCISCFGMIIVYNGINVSTYLNFIESRKRSIRAKADDDQPLVTEKNVGMLCGLVQIKAAADDPTNNNYRIVIVSSSGNNYGGAAGLNRQLL